MTTPAREVAEIKELLSAIIPDLVARERLHDLADLHTVLKREAELIETVVKT